MSTPERDLRLALLDRARSDLGCSTVFLFRRAKPTEAEVLARARAYWAFVEGSEPPPAPEVGVGIGGAQGQGGAGTLR